MKVQGEEIVREDALTASGGTTALPANDCGGREATALPMRKRIDHRGPLSINVSGAWYFITICAEGHRSWVGSRVPRDRGGAAVGSRVPRDRGGAAVGSRVPRDRGGAVGSRVPRDRDFDFIANTILSAARWYHEHGKWRLALFLVMPDHVHFIVHVPDMPNVCGHVGRVTLPMVSIIQQFKSYLVRTHGISFQRDFFDTRLRDDAHYAEIFHYICNNPVRRELCAAACEWPYAIVFDRATGEERERRGISVGGRGATALPANDCGGRGATALPATQED